MLHGKKYKITTQHPYEQEVSLYTGVMSSTLASIE